SEQPASEQPASEQPASEQPASEQPAEPARPSAEVSAAPPTEQARSESERPPRRRRRGKRGGAAADKPASQGVAAKPESAAKPEPAKSTGETRAARRDGKPPQRERRPSSAPSTPSESFGEHTPAFMLRRPPAA
ncbi:MAG: hypothetical protein ACREDZ_15890, partial [Kiloniellales bacterium]